MAKGLHALIYETWDAERLFRMLDEAGFITGAWHGLQLADLPVDQYQAFITCLRRWDEGRG